MKNLIIFDCDGVLVDSETIGCGIDAQAVTKMGYPITTEEFIKRYTGISDKTMASRIKEDAGISIPAEYLEARINLILKAFETELQPLINPVLSMLDHLQITRCVASGSRRNRVIRSLEITQQIKYFNEDSIFTAQQVEKGKPAPDLFLFAAKQMATEPQQCLVIEDSVAGVQAAKAANMDVIGFLGGDHAKYQWYQDRIKTLGIPLAYTTEELKRLIKRHLKDAA